MIFKDVCKYTLTAPTRWLFHCNFRKGFYVPVVSLGVVPLNTHTHLHVDGPQKSVATKRDASVTYNPTVSFGGIIKIIFLNL